jgi:hypothetical protein
MLIGFIIKCNRNVPKFSNSFVREIKLKTKVGNGDLGRFRCVDIAGLHPG